MLHQVIQAPGAQGVDGISDTCSEVTLGCSDVSGLVQQVLASSEKLRDEHTALLGTVATLNEDQDQVAQACEESRKYSAVLAFMSAVSMFAAVCPSMRAA